MSWQRVSLEVSRAAMEASWLFAGAATLALLSGYGELALSSVAVFLLVGSAFLAARLLQHLDLSLTFLRALGVLLAATVVLGTARMQLEGRFAPWDLVWFFDPEVNVPGGDKLRGEVLAVGLGVVLWWRGMRLAQREVLWEDVLRSFALGLVVVVGTILLETFLKPQERAASIAFPFFLFGLLALALSHLADVEERKTLSSQAPWPLLAGAIAVTVLFMGILLGLLPLHRVWRMVLAFGQVLDQAVFFVLYGIFLIAGLAAELLIRLGRWLISLLGLPPARPLEGIGQDDLLQRLRERTQEQAGPPELLIFLIKAVIVSLVVLAVLVLLARAFNRWAIGQGPVEGEERESLWGEADLGRDLRALLQRVLGIFRGQRPVVTSGLEGLQGEAWQRFLAVQRLYLSLLAHAATLGQPRQPWQTPLEYQERLLQLFASGGQEVARITVAFARARYGLLLPSSEELGELQEDWERLRRG